MQESETTEFKEGITDSIKKTVIAFANTRGGTIYVGVRDDGTAAGLADADAVMQQVANMIRDTIKPDVTMFVRYEFEVIDSVQVLAIHVGEGTNKPYYSTRHGLKPAGVFVRQGAASVPVSDEQIRRMIRDTDGDSFEKMRSLNQELSFETARAEFEKRQLTFDAAHMQTLGLYDAAGLFTNVALLLSEQNPFTIKCAVFAGCDQDEFQNRREFSGSLLNQLSEVYTFIGQYNQLGSVIKGLYRIDTRDYPETAIREALLNCLIHRDYSYSASTLISLYADRIEFVSIGGLLPGVTLADVQMGLSVCRNNMLADIFYRLTLIEAYGTGLRKIQNAYKDALQKPQIITAPNSFKIILPNRNNRMTEEHSDKKTQRVIASGIHTADERAIIEYARTHGDFVRSEIDTLLHISQSTSSRLLKRMIENGMLVQHGTGKSATYRLAD